MNARYGGTRQGVKRPYQRDRVSVSARERRVPLYTWPPPVPTYIAPHCSTTAQNPLPSDMAAFCLLLMLVYAGAA